MFFSGDTIRQVESTVTRGALIVAIFSVLSRLAGVLRDRLLASTFGAGTTLDAYYAAFKIPDFIFNTFVLGAMAAALIPIFVHYRERQGLASSYELSNKVLNLLIVILVVGASLAALWAPGLVKLIVPGFDLSALALTVKLTRIMLVAVVIFGASNVVGSVLQAQQRLIAFALAPVLYNVGIIAGIYFFVPWLGAVGLGCGVVLGSLFHWAAQTAAAWKIGWRWQIIFSWQDAGLRQVLKLLIPRTLGLIASQINQVVTVAFVSTLTVGSLAAFSLALNLHSFPINVFGVSLAVAVFPLLSQAVSASNHDYLVHYFSRNVRRILFYVLPLSVLFLVLRAQLVRVILGSGAFDWGDTIQTARVLGFLSLAIAADSVLPLVARTFYALKDTKTPVAAALVSIAINVLLLITLRSFGLAGVGIAYVCSSIVNLTLLVAILGNRLGNLGASWIIAGVWRMMIGSLAAAAATYGTLYLVAPHVNMNTFVGVFTQGFSAGLVGVVSYVVVSVALNLPEVQFARRWLRGALKLLTLRM